MAGSNWGGCSRLMADSSLSGRTWYMARETIRSHMCTGNLIVACAYAGMGTIVVFALERSVALACIRL